MTERERILHSLCSGRAANEPSVLATVVSAAGSTYRRPGARALIHPDGSATGLISGGCLEQDLLERARDVFADSQPRLVSYDANATADVVWGLGLGCPGIVKVLLEFNPPGSIPPVLAFAEECRTEQRRGVAATAVDEQHGALVISRIMAALPDTVVRNVPDAELDMILMRGCHDALITGQSRTTRQKIGSQTVEAFYEVFEEPRRLFVVGAGADAVPLVRMAKEIGWDVVLIDDRPAYLTPDKFPDADECILAVPQTFPDTVTMGKTDAAIIMTHNYARDFTALKALLQSYVGYIGLLGPKSKSAMMMRQMSDEGYSVPAERLNCLFSPAGLDIGAETPEEIALSIIAEIRAVAAGRTGEPLRQREAPIH